MQFTQQTITILNREGRPQQVEAMVGEGTGLGYYPSERGYVVTTINSGYYVAYLEYYDELHLPGSPINKQIIHQFIETIAPWLDWEKSREEIEAQAAFCFGSLDKAQGSLYRAFTEVQHQVWVAETSK